MKPIAAALLLSLMTSLAGAQSVYRCGNSYSESPCPEGGGMIDVSDPRSAEQRAEARRVAADERRLAADLQRERLADEKAIRPMGATSLGGPSAANPTAAAQTRHLGKTRRAAKLFPAADLIVLDPGRRERRGNAR